MVFFGSSPFHFISTHSSIQIPFLDLHLLPKLEFWGLSWFLISFVVKMTLGFKSSPLIKLLDLGHIIYFIQLMFPFYNPFFNSNVMMIHQVFIQLHVPFYNSFFNSNVMIHQVFIQLMFLSTTLFLISKWWSTKFSYNSCSFLQTFFLISNSWWFTKLHIWFM
jgi:hypothetical protein